MDHFYGGGADSGFGRYSTGSNNPPRLISHGFDPSGCSYETDGEDFIDSGMADDMLLSPFSSGLVPYSHDDLADAAVDAAGDPEPQSTYRGPITRQTSETMDKCTKRIEMMTLLAADKESRASYISTDSGFLSGIRSFDSTSCWSGSFPEDECQIDSILSTFFDEDGDTHLHVAIAHKREDAVCDILQCQLPPGYVNFRDSHARSSLHLAVLSNQPDLLHPLFQAGADPNARDLNGETPLHIACANGYLDCMKTLVTLMTFFYRKSDIDPDVKNYRGFTSLHMAAARGHHDVVAFLVRHFGADVNVGDGCSGRTILHHAADSGDVKMVKFLLQEFSDSINVQLVAHDKRTTPLALALGRGHEQISELLIKSGAKYPCHCDTDMLTDSDEE